MANEGTVLLPCLEVEATSYRPELDYLGIAVRLNNLAVSQYCGCEFDSMVKFAGMYLGAGQEGLFTLEDADTDDGREINAVVEFPNTDMGISNQKRFRSLYFGGEASGDLTVTVIADEDVEEEYTLTTIDASNNQHGNKVSVNRGASGKDHKGRYWTIRVENVDGCDFSIDMIEAIVNILSRRPSGE